MSLRTITFTIADRIARLTLNRPERLNSFTALMHAEVREALASLGDARVLVMTGAGRGFCAGQDLNDRTPSDGQPVDLGATVEADWNPLVRALASLPQPVIARVNGVAAARKRVRTVMDDLLVGVPDGQDGERYGGARRLDATRGLDAPPIIRRTPR